MYSASAALVTVPASTTRTSIARSPGSTRSVRITIWLYVPRENPIGHHVLLLLPWTKQMHRWGRREPMNETSDLRWSDDEAARIVRETYGAVVPEGAPAV